MQDPTQGTREAEGTFQSQGIQSLLKGMQREL